MPTPIPIPIIAPLILDRIESSDGLSLWSLRRSGLILDRIERITRRLQRPPVFLARWSWIELKEAKERAFCFHISASLILDRIESQIPEVE